MLGAAVALFAAGEVAQAGKARKVTSAAPVAKTSVTPHTGKVVSIMEGKDGKDGKLVMSDAADKKEHTHAVLATTKITLNKKSGKLADLKKGDQVTVTVDSGNKATAITATRDAK